MKYWEIIAGNLHKAGFSLGWVSALDFEGEQSGLLTRMATTGSVMLCGLVRSKLRLWNWNQRFAKTALRLVGAIWQSRARVKSGRCLRLELPLTFSPPGFPVSECSFAKTKLRKHENH
jgi:hypothetical protein